MAPKKHKLGPLLVVLRDLQKLLKQQNIEGVIIGGVAASLLGRPRLTRDVDALVILDEKKWNAFFDTAVNIGFEPRTRDAIAFARKARVLLLRHARTGIDLDISLGLLPFESGVLKRAKSVSVGGVVLKLPTPEDLVIMKALARRERDLSDIEGILDAHPKIEIERVLSTVDEIAIFLEAPEILTTLEQLLLRRKSGKLE